MQIGTAIWCDAIDCMSQRIAVANSTGWIKDAGAIVESNNGDEVIRSEVVQHLSEAFLYARHLVVVCHRATLVDDENEIERAQVSTLIDLSSGKTDL